MATQKVQENREMPDSVRRTFGQFAKNATGLFVLKAGDTMVGTLVTPQVTTPIVASSAGLALNPTSGGLTLNTRQAYMSGGVVAGGTLAANQGATITLTPINNLTFIIPCKVGDILKVTSSITMDRLATATAGSLVTIQHGVTNGVATITNPVGLYRAATLNDCGVVTIVGWFTATTTSVTVSTQMVTSAGTDYTALSGFCHSSVERLMTL